MENKQITFSASYFIGWSWIIHLSEKKQINKLVKAEIISIEDDGMIIRTLEPELFSWGNGPTLPSRDFILYNDGTIGYMYQGKKNKFGHSIPKWSNTNIINELENSMKNLSLVSS